MERFVIQFGTVGIEEQANPNSNIKVWSANKTIHILNPEYQKGTINVINIFGQKLIETQLNGSNYGGIKLYQKKKKSLLD